MIFPPIDDQKSPPPPVGRSVSYIGSLRVDIHRSPRIFLIYLRYVSAVLAKKKKKIHFRAESSSLIIILLTS